MTNIPSGLRKNVPLAPYTTFRIGGPAKYFFVAKNKKELASAIKWAKQKDLPFFILGGGSNILVSDDGFEGLVIKIMNDELRIMNRGIYTEAGVMLSRLIDESAKAGLSGLEWAAGIPGTVGGAILGNAGAYGHSISESVKSVEVLDVDKTIKSRHSVEDHRKIQKSKIFNFSGQLSNEKCLFSYRYSVFKELSCIILSATFSFKKKDPDQIRNKIKQVLAARDQKIPSQPSAGCVFKNIFVADWPRLKKQIPADRIQDGKVATGYLIEQCGLKGQKIGQAQISEKHANFIVNLGQAKAEDVKKLIEVVKQEVQKKFGVKLEKEVVSLFSS